ncbi:hypothetical protein ACROYT_G018999 [Oculina patagonica]
MASPVGEKTAGLQEDVQKESTEGSSHSILERWEDFHVKLLVSCWQKQKLEFGKGKATKKEIFNKIAEFNTIYKDVKVTGEQCSRKWQKLEAAHKKITDHNNNTGADKKSWKYFDEMESCIGGNPNVRPKFTLESSSSNTTDPASDDSDETDDDEIEGSQAGTSSATKRKGKEGAHGSKQRKRKRKSKSSAAEMLAFLTQYAEQREESEREKTELMKEMKEERKSFFDQFLKIMGQRK